MQIRRSREDATRLVEENVKLVYWLARVTSISGIDFDDRVGLGMLALWKAALTWDESKKQFFSYACRVIKNEWGMEKKKLWVRRNLNYHLSERVLDEEGAVATPEELLPDAAADTEAAAVNRVVIRQALERLSRRDQRVFLLWATGLSETEVSKAVGLSRPQINRIVRRKLRDEQDA